jgi:divalent metal cation (Fe/Co/Zn/Cd) transporter
MDVAVEFGSQKTPILAGYKLKLAARLQSKALRADAMEVITCVYFSIVLMIGLAATSLFGWWWLDSVAAPSSHSVPRQRGT